MILTKDTRLGSDGVVAKQRQIGACRFDGPSLLGSFAAFTPFRFVGSRADGLGISCQPSSSALCVRLHSQLPGCSRPRHLPIFPPAIIPLFLLFKPHSERRQHGRDSVWYRFLQFTAKPLSRSLGTDLSSSRSPKIVSILASPSYTLVFFPSYSYAPAGNTHTDYLARF